MTAAAKIIVKGRVQGVGYRYFASREARLRKISGYVKNLYNGDVEIVAQGEKEMILNYIEDLRSGPDFSVVSDMIIDWQECNNKYTDFNITF